MNSAEVYQRVFGKKPAITAAAPGRLEFIGNHTDYNGGMVLGVAIDRGIQVSLSARTDKKIGLYSAHHDKKLTLDIAAVKPLQGADSWANYPLGVWNVLKTREFPVAGFDMVITSDLPLGAGMSSSAAFELATAYGLSAIFGFSADRKTFARIGRQAENQFVGVPCGILDQGVSAFGEKDHLVLIDCAAEEFSTVPAPEGTHFWVFNSQKKHALLDSLYATRHKECMDALAILKRYHPDLKGLAHATPAEVEAHKDELGPVLYKRARHVSEENGRVRACLAQLERKDLPAVGKLLHASHESSRTLFENSVPELDFLVQQLEGKPGVFGARLTGGGFGGAVMALTDAHFSEKAAEDVIAAYAAKFGNKPTLFHARSGDGARIC